MGRPGRRQGAPRGRTAQANELAAFVCTLTHGRTVRELADRYPAGKTSWGEYRTGAKIIPLVLLRALAADGAPDAWGRAKLLTKAEHLHARAEAARQATGRPPTAGGRPAAGARTSSRQRTAGPGPAASQGQAPGTGARRGTGAATAGAGDRDEAADGEHGADGTDGARAAKVPSKT